MTTQTTKQVSGSWKEIVSALKEAQHEVRRKLMQGEPLATVFRSLIFIVQRFSPDTLGAIVVFEASGSSLRKVCAPDLPDGIVEQLERVPEGENTGLNDISAFTGKQSTVVQGIADDPTGADLQEQAQNFKACWSEPVISSASGKVLGTIALYCTSPRQPTDEEVTLLEIAGDIAGAAIEWEQALNERRALEAELRHKNEELDERVKAGVQQLEYQNYINTLITENATVGLFMMDENGYCTFLNAAAEQMTGYSLQEIRLKPLHDMIHHTHPDGTPYPMYECPIDSALPLNNDVRAHEDVFIRKDGSFFPVTCAASPIQVDGVPIGTIVEVRDTTEEKLYEEEIKDSTERLRLILEAMPQISWTAAKNGELDYINGTWFEYSGTPKEEALGNAWIAAVHPDDRLRVIERWQESLVKGHQYEINFRIRSHNGSYRWFLVRAVPLVAQDGSIMKWFGTCTDTHEQRMALEELAYAQEQLKATNEELSAANKELTVTNADLDNFIYAASHDLRSPIVNLEGLLTALREELDHKPPIVEKLLGMMGGAIARFQKTIAELTEISRTQKNLENSNEVVQLPELLEEVKQSIAQAIREADATVETDLGGIKTINFSRKNCRSILYNLISNSIKYRSPERPAEVKVSAKHTEDGFVLLKVEDNGLGFSMDNTDQLFTMFKRLHDHVEGSGVGLYIVKRIVENAGGTIEAAGEPGKGASFSIYLPVGS